LLAAVVLAAVVLSPISAFAQPPTLSVTVDPGLIAVQAGQQAQFGSEITNVTGLQQTVCADSLSLEGSQYFTEELLLPPQMPIPVDAGDTVSMSAFVLTPLSGAPTGDYKGYWAVADANNTLSDYSEFTVRVLPSTPTPEFGTLGTLWASFSLLALRNVLATRVRYAKRASRALSRALLNCSS